MGVERWPEKLIAPSGAGKEIFGRKAGRSMTSSPTSMGMMFSVQSFSRTPVVPGGFLFRGLNFLKVTVFQTP